MRGNVAPPTGVGAGRYVATGWIRDVNVPLELLQAARATRLVLFVGAGASMDPPANLPGFNALVTDVGTRAGRPPTEADLERPDVFLGDLVDDGVEVHNLVAKAIDLPGSAPNQLHRAIVDLARHHRPVRIVTTNYDRHLTGRQGWRCPAACHPRVQASDHRLIARRLRDFHNVNESEVECRFADYLRGQGWSSSLESRVGFSASFRRLGRPPLCCCDDPACCRDEPRQPSRRGCRPRTNIGLPAAAPVVIAIATSGGGSDEPSTASQAPTAFSQQEERPVAETQSDPVENEAPAEPEMTLSLENAVQSAKNYLGFKAFSKRGLIPQLSSKAGDCFARADAVYAVNHIKVNWNEQAARAAKEYLNMMSFSHDGLVQQLSSKAGDGYTRAQAEYGVSQAGL
jgi:hypothetical protein